MNEALVRKLVGVFNRVLQSVLEEVGERLLVPGWRFPNGIMINIRFVSLSVNPDVHRGISRLQHPEGQRSSALRRSEQGLQAEANDA